MRFFRRPEAALILAGWLATPNVDAALQGRSLHGNGMDSNPNTFEAYYDTVLNVTWLADANLLFTQYTADVSILQAIIDGKPVVPDPLNGGLDRAYSSYGDTNYHLTQGDSANGVLGDFHDSAASPYAVTGAVSFYAARAYLKWLNAQSYGGFSDWRMPKVSPRSGNNFAWGLAYDGSRDEGYNITSSKSELSHLFYVGLQNSALYDTGGNPVTGGGLVNTASFSNLQSALYWYRTDDAAQALAWTFDNSTGGQNPGGLKLDTSAYVMVLRNGDITAPNHPVPDPDPCLNADPDASVNSPPELTAEQATDPTHRLDATVGSLTALNLSASDVECHAMALKFLQRPAGMTMTPTAGIGTIASVADWTPPKRYADKNVQWVVQARETSRADHQEATKRLLKSLPMTVHLRVFPAGKTAVNGVRTVKITQAKWDDAAKKLTVAGTITPLRILYASEVEALYAPEHSVGLETVHADPNQPNAPIDAGAIAISGGTWQTEVALDSPPCRIAAKFTDSASKPKAVRGAPARNCIK